MEKTKSHIYLFLSLLLVALLVWIDYIGIIPDLTVDISKYQVETNDMIFNFFNIISNIFTFSILVILLFIKPRTRKFARIALIQLLIAILIYYIFKYSIENFGFSISYFYKINTSIYFSYSLFFVFILNFHDAVSSLFMKTLLLIASLLYIFMLTTGQFYFMNITFFSLAVNISFVFVTTSLAYFLIFLRKYYFL